MVLLLYHSHQDAVSSPSQVEQSIHFDQTRYALKGYFLNFGRAYMAHGTIVYTMLYRTAGYCCEVQIFAICLKCHAAEIFAIANFASADRMIIT